MLRAQGRKQPVNLKNLALAPLAHAPGRALPHFLRRGQGGCRLLGGKGRGPVVGHYQATAAGHSHKHNARLLGRLHQQGLQAAEIVRRPAKAGAPARLQGPDQGLGSVHHILGHGFPLPLTAADGKRRHGRAQDEGQTQQHPGGKAADP